MNTARTLPIRVAPLPGEALDSWLEAISQRLRSAFGDTLASVGLTVPGGIAIERSWLTRLPSQIAEQISVATGQPLDRLHEMTLAHYERMGLEIRRAPPPGRRPGPWSRTNWSRYCPYCLTDSGGRWQLEWRLGWIFACDKHRCLLVDICPACRRGHRERFFPGDLVPRPGFCANPALGASGRSAKRCATDLSTVPTTRFSDDDHPTLNAQRAIRKVITEDRAAFGIYRDHPVAAADFLSDVRALATKVLSQTATSQLKCLLPADLLETYRNAQTENRDGADSSPTSPGFRARPSAITTATAITAVANILDHDTLAGAGRVLAKLEDYNRSNGISADWPTTGWARGTTKNLAAARLTGRGPLLLATQQLRYCIGGAQPGMPSLGDSDVNELARKLPAVLWSEWAVPLTVPGLDPSQLASSLPAIVRLVNSRITHSQACAALGSSTTLHKIPNQLRKLAANAHWPDTRLAIIRLADYLHRNPTVVDYQRRRSLDYKTLLVADTWETICSRLDIRSGGQKRLRVARCYLYCIISGNPADLAPWFVDNNDFQSALYRFPTVLTPDLLAALSAEAETLLQDNGIQEPVTWYPPRKLMAGLILPGANPDRIPIAKLHRLIRQQTPLSDAAQTLRTTPEAVRHILTNSPAPEHRSGPTSKPAPALSALAEKLSEGELRDLYINQGVPLQEIAERYGADRKVVTRLARRSAIPLRPPHRPRQHDEVDRDWLYTEYVLNRRTLPELAAEKGMSTMNMARWAKFHDIPRRGRGGPSHSATLTAERSTAQAPAILRPALAGIGGWERLQRFVEAAKYPTLTIAANELGVHQFSLVNQINRIERELGKKLLERAERGRPMRLNRDGAAVVRAVKSYERKRGKETLS